MTVATTSNKQRTTGNGVTTAFPANIKIQAETDIIVTTILNATDTLSNTLILNDGGALGYTVTFDTDAETLTVNVNTAPLATEDLQTLRGLPLTQTAEFPEVSKFPSVSVGNAHDKSTMILQDFQEIIARTFKGDENTSITNFELSGIPIVGRGFKFSNVDGSVVLTDGDPDQAQTDSAASATAAATSETNAAVSETNAAASAAKLQGTSTTSRLIAVASKIFTTQADKFFTAGTWLLVTSDADPTNYMHGQVTSYSGTTLTLNVTNTGGSGTFADWTITVSGTRGALGPISPDASETVKGIIELATQTEVDTATDTVRAITPATLLAAPSSGLVLLSTVTASNSASMDFTSFIDSTYEVYELHIINLVPVTDGSQVNFRVSTDGGSTFKAGTSDYLYAITGSRDDALSFTHGSTGSTNIPMVVAGGTGNVGNEKASGVIRIFNPASSTETTVVMMTGMFLNASGQLTSGYGSGIYNATTAVDAFQIIMSAGNITSAEGKLYGGKK